MIILFISTLVSAIIFLFLVLKWSMLEFRLAKLLYPNKYKDIDNYIEFIITPKRFAKPFSPELPKEEWDNERIRETEDKINKIRKRCALFGVLWIGLMAITLVFS